VAVAATSLTNAVTTDLSNAPFSTANAGPQIDLVDSFFSAEGFRLVFEVVKGSEPRFLDGLKVEISTDEAGTQFVEAPRIKFKQSGKRIQLRGQPNGMTYSQLIPETGSRLVRFTNPNCGLTIIRVRRMGDLLVPVAAGFEAESVTNQGLTNWQ
jgi:hypothetical protein